MSNLLILIAGGISGFLLLAALILIILKLAKQSEQTEYSKAVNSETEGLAMDSSVKPAGSSTAKQGEAVKQVTIEKSAPTEPSKNATRDNELIAVLSAALHAFISSEQGNEGETFKIKSYRRIDNTSAQVWNRAGRLLQTLGRSQGF